MRTAVFFIVLCAAALSCAFPTPDDDTRHGVAVDVHREKNVGTRVSVSGETNLWKSDNGRSRMDAGASWDRVFDGPRAGRPNYSAGINFRHEW